jgi:Photosynthetic reaction centre cytochrome C subunit
MRNALMAAALVLTVATSRAEQKNVQVLTGLTDAQLLDVMNFMRGSLGVHCDFCHVVEKGKGWDFPNDAKPNKRTARRMIEMVGQINDQNFEGKPVVACNTCHRGNTQPVSLPVLPQAAPPFPTPVHERPSNLPTRDAVVAKYAAAIGDASRLQLPRVFHGTRESASDDKSAPIEGQISGGKVHVVGQTPFGLTEQVFIGTAGWVKTSKGTHAMEETERTTFRKLTDAYEPLRPESIPADAHAVNIEKVGDHDTVVLLGRVDANTRERLFFDTTSGLLVRRLVLHRSPVGEIPQQTDFDDYRDVGGTRFPFFVRVSLMDPWTSATRHYSDVELGAAVDDKVFDPLPVTPSTEK